MVVKRPDDILLIIPFVSHIGYDKIKSKIACLSKSFTICHSFPAPPPTLSPFFLIQKISRFGFVFFF